MSRPAALRLLRIAFAVAIGIPSCSLALSAGPPFLRVLGAVELLAAAAFVFDVTMKVGAALLLVVFAVASLHHIKHGELVTPLIVYALFVILTLISPPARGKTA